MDPHYSDLHYMQQHDQWMERSSGYNGQHHSPMEEYPSFGFGSSPPMQPGFATTTMHRPALQPIVTTPWPSMLASNHQHQQQQQQHHHQHHHHSSLYQPQPQSLHSLPTPTPHNPSPLQTSPPSATPHLGSSHPAHTSSTPRRTLTDNDRRKMCQYHEENPTKKQTEIGELFGVERSTVSKVLRQKEKYLRVTESTVSSPLSKSAKKNKPDLDRALAKWATNQAAKGVIITDDNIKTQAHFFWTAAGNTGDLPLKVDSQAWLEKFKMKNGLERRGSDFDAESLVSPSEETPISPEDALSRNVSPTGGELRRQGSGAFDGLGIRGAALRAPMHSQSNTSLSSAFTDHTGATAFSSENTSVGSPVVSPDALHNSSSYFPPSATPLALTHNRPQSTQSQADNSIRPRSQTFPLTSAADPYISPPQSANTSSPLNTSTAAVFDSPTVSAADMPPPPPPHIHKLPNTPSHHSPLSPHSSHASSLRHPSLSKTKSTPHLSTSLRHASASSPSLGDAKRGLEMAVSYLKSQGLGNDSTEVATLRSVMMRMQVSQTATTSHVPPRSSSVSGSVELPGGLHRIPELGDSTEDDAMTGMEFGREGEF